ncbi:hypothetical protein [Catellatospora sichuanensis]|uniref:hypothetical protein n=1 Tax=Catellatospora sichuanensis TaxID=1969805 RepID=UPI0016428202|nr:hypothetical protein [Catellatospora sichuanensis]
MASIARSAARRANYASSSSTAGSPTPNHSSRSATSASTWGYEELKVGIEYDGSSRLTRDRIRHDRHRGNRLATQGWHMRHFTDADLYRHPARILTTLRPLLTPP